MKDQHSQRDDGRIELKQLAANRPDSEDLEAVLHMGFLHISFINEAHETAVVSPGALSGLVALGKEWFDRELAYQLFMARSFGTVGDLSQHHAYGRMNFGPWVLEFTDLPAQARVGHSIESDGVNAKIATDIIYGLLGRLVYTQFTDVASAIVDPYFEIVLHEGKRTEEHASILAKLAPEKTQEWTYAKQGPDHASVFIATLKTEDGRLSTGSGTSKKTARASAGKQFVKKYGAQNASKQVQMPWPRLVDITNSKHKYLIQCIQPFAPSRKWQALYYQAFFHTSWIFENQQFAQRTFQTDNQCLAFLGAKVLSYEYTASVTSAQIDGNIESYTHLSQTNESLTLAARLVGLDRALLLGRGQQRLGVSPEMCATVLQALAGAIFVDSGKPSSVVPTVSIPWSRALSLLTPGIPRDHDPVTKLQDLLVKSQVELVYEILEVTGPPNNQRHVARLHLNSKVLGSTISVTSTPATSVKGAKADAALTPIRALEWLRKASGAPPPLLAHYVSFFGHHLELVDRLDDTQPRITKPEARAVNDTHEELASEKQEPDVIGRTLNEAHLAFEVLPVGVGTRNIDFASDRTRLGLLTGSSYYDAKRTAIIDQIARKYGIENCVLYRGYTVPGIHMPVGDNINDEYLILAITRRGGEDAVAISSAVGRHATYVVRHEVSEKPWYEIFSRPKYSAKDFGARRLVFRERFPLDQYNSMREKILLLLQCPPRSFQNRMQYEASKRSYVMSL